MKKLIIILMAAVFLISANFAIAQPTVGFPMNSVFCPSAENALVMPAGKEIYGYSFYAHTITAWFVMVDDKDTSYSTSAVIAEGGQAAAYKITTVWFPKPLVTANGCSVSQVDGYLTIYYQK